MRLDRLDEEPPSSTPAIRPALARVILAAASSSPPPPPPATMPTSTLWRRDASASLRRGSSPVRPTLAVERISPEPRGASPPPLVVGRARAHARSRSTIDDLADAAIATSPSLPAAATTTAPPAPRPATSHITRYAFHDGLHDGFGDPPAKRVKSDIVRQYEFEFAFGYDRPRPATSHVTAEPAHAIPDEDVALLLALKQEVNFKTQLSPVVAAVPATAEPGPGEALGEAAVAVAVVTSTDRQVNGNHSRDEQQQPPRRQDQRRQDQRQEQAAAEPAPKTEAAATEAAAMEATATATEATATEVSATEEARTEDQKPRRVRPLVQAEVCAQCGRLQHDSSDDDVAISWICCNPCNRWFHSACVGFKSKAEARSVDKFVCAACQPAHGPSTFVRTSSRARTAIDYAELNQGLVKSAVDSPLHHYIEPLKTGKFAVQPDDFMRVAPELVTAEFLQSFDNMKRPTGPAGQDLLTECFDSSGAALGRQTATAAAAAAAAAAADGNDAVDTELVVDCDQDLLDMVMPRHLTVRTVAELYGKHNTVAVIDVKSQESKNLTLEQWADYYEAAGDKPIRNVISLEVTQCPLGRVMRRPKAVRDLDLEDAVWTADARGSQKRRHVQYYCLMSVADSYTDFHIDFGGSSVYYHILRGTKTFFFIPPEERYLRKYEEWCNSQDQSDTWLPSLCNGNVTRVDLHPGDTAFIPAGWIHSVWTPDDSLVIGGNFLTAIDYELQLKVVQIEKATNVATTFRYPFFQKVMWFALIKYLDDDPVPDDVRADFVADPDHVYLRATPVWLELGHLANVEPPGSAAFNARYYPKAEVRGWPALRDYLYRTARIYADLPVDNINKKQIDAVKASVPKAYGDPLAMIKTFAIWCAWKMGSVAAPPWLHSDSPPLAEADGLARKKPEAYRVPGERKSKRRAAQLAQRDATGPAVVTPYRPGFNAAGVNSDPGKKGRPPSTKPVAARVACEACRRRRVKCKHKDVEPAANAASADAPPPITNIVVAPAPATLDAQPAAADPHNTGTANALISSPKKSRSKACEECRKSKRRCVHDEFGRVDPAKAAEPSKPRGSSSAKRPARPSEDGSLAKRVKVDDGPARIESVLDPALLASPPASNHSNPQPSFATATPTTPKNANGTAVKVEADGDAHMTGDATPAADPYEHAILDSPESNQQMLQAQEHGLRRRTMSMRLQ
ncbi:hypothetical protein DV737_g1191, partial [Chaetothyriales sp. CBS 132003]